MNMRNGMNVDWSRKAYLWPTAAAFAWKHAVLALYMFVTKVIVYLTVPMSTLKIKVVKTVVFVRPGSRILCSERRENRKTAKEAPAGTHATERWQCKNASVRKLRTSNKQTTNNKTKNQSKTNKKRLKMENGAPSFKNKTHFFRKRSIKPYNSSIDDRKRTIRSCRIIENEVERCVSSGRPDWLIASVTQGLTTMGDLLVRWVASPRSTWWLKEVGR